jgi:hypothetical protein
MSTAIGGPYFFAIALEGSAKARSQALGHLKGSYKTFVVRTCGLYMRQRAMQPCTILRTRSILTIRLRIISPPTIQQNPYLAIWFPFREQYLYNEPKDNTRQRTPNSPCHFVQVIIPGIVDDMNQNFADIPQASLLSPNVPRSKPKSQIPALPGHAMSLRTENINHPDVPSHTQSPRLFGLA